MFAVSLTIMNHSQQLLDLIKELTEKKVTIMNSAVFHAGFLTGGNFFNYRKVNLAYEQDKVLFDWREKFFGICNQFHVKPAEACVQFGMSPPGVISVSLNTSKPERVRQNVRLVQTKVPEEFWVTMKEEGLIDRNYPFVG
jgi:D-threo-aldose 1-dehydrogenase